MNTVEVIESNRNSLISLDIARAFAALSVFVYHYQLGHVLAQRTGIRRFEYLGVPGAVFAVPLFFALSGFCIHGAEWHRFRRAAVFEWKGYTVRRFRRVYPAYLAALVLSVVVNVLQGAGVDQTDVSVHALLLQGFSTPYFNTINLVLWTISVECCFYAVYPLWLKLRLAVGLWLAFAIGGSISVVTWVVTAVFFYPYSLPAQWFFLNTWIGWLAGAVVAEVFERNRKLLRTVAWWSTGIAAWVVLLSADALGFFDGRSLILWRPALIIASLWPLTGILLTERRIRECSGVSKSIVLVISAVGLSSYSLYLMHEPLISLRNIVQTQISPGGARSLFQASWFFAVILLCWLSYQTIEIRFMRKSRGVPLAIRPDLQ